MLDPQVYTPSQRSSSPQLSLGIEAPAPTWKQKSVFTRLGFLVDTFPDVMGAAIKSLPAVLLGCLLNVLDSVSCRQTFLFDGFLLSLFDSELTFILADGMIIFPSTGVFANLGPMGVSMFFLT